MNNANVNTAVLGQKLYLGLFWSKLISLELQMTSSLFVTNHQIQQTCSDCSSIHLLNVHFME